MLELPTQSTKVALARLLRGNPGGRSRALVRPAPAVPSQRIGQAISEAKADAVAVASLLHYDFIRNNEVDADNAQEGNISFLKSGKSFSKIDPSDLRDIKKYLHQNGVECRMGRG